MLAPKNKQVMDNCRSGRASPKAFCSGMTRTPKPYSTVAVTQVATPSPARIKMCQPRLNSARSTRAVVSPTEEVELVMVFKR